MSKRCSAGCLSSTFGVDICVNFALMIAQNLCYDGVGTFVIYGGDKGDNTLVDRKKTRMKG